jgi:ATP-dependent DNA ligase
VAKRIDSTYRSGRRGWIKVKRWRSADVVVGGLRGDRFLLGLYDGGVLHHVGETTVLAPGLISAIIAMTTWDNEVRAFTGRPPGVGRWQGDRYDEWIECDPSVVVEVSYTQLEGARFRHPVRLLRLRHDKDVTACGFDQLTGSGGDIGTQLSGHFGQHG